MTSQTKNKGNESREINITNSSRRSRGHDDEQVTDLIQLARMPTRFASSLTPATRSLLLTVRPVRPCASATISSSSAKPLFTDAEPGDDPGGVIKRGKPADSAGASLVLPSRDTTTTAGTFSRGAVARSSGTGEVECVEDAWLVPSWC